MVSYEADAAAASTGDKMDLEANNNASRLFEKEFQSFLSAGRTCWNYLRKAAKAAGCQDWLDERFSGRIFVFHRLLADQDLHAYQVTPGVNQTVRWEADADTPWVQTPLGPLPAKMTIVGFAGVKYRYEPKNLEPEIIELLEGVVREYGTNGIIELASRYYDGLCQVVKSASRRGRFETSS
jgi:hypothetical protein